MSMSSYLSAIATDEFASIKEFLSTQLKVPEEAVEKWGAAGCLLSLLAGRSGESQHDFEATWFEFEQFCQSAEHVPRGCLLYASIAYSTAAMAMNTSDSTLEDSDRVRYMLSAAEARTAASFTFKLRSAQEAKTEHAERRAMLSAAGLKGSQLKNAKYEAVRKWVRDQIAMLRTDDRKSSQQLAARLPAHLADVSMNPERFIYDVLRSIRKEK